MAGGTLNNTTMGSLSLLSVLLLGISTFHCGGEEEPEFVLMTFLIPITVTPETTEIPLGDTVWISGSFPDTLKEIHSGRYFRLKDFDFRTDFCLRRINDPNLFLGLQPAAFNDFDVIGSLQISSPCGTFPILYANNHYHYRVALVARTSGVFNLLMLRPDWREEIDLRPHIDLHKTPDGRRRIPIYESFDFLINNGNPGLELQRQNGKQGASVWAEEMGSFTFRVIG